MIASTLSKIIPAIFSWCSLPCGHCSRTHKMTSSNTCPSYCSPSALMSLMCAWTLVFLALACLQYLLLKFLLFTVVDGGAVSRVCMPCIADHCAPLDLACAG